MFKISNGTIQAAFVVVQADNSRTSIPLQISFNCIVEKLHFHLS